MKILISLFLFVSTHAFAGAPDYTIHQEYTSTRALGMGNAFIAVADDHSAMFYNPAALALRKDGEVHAFLRAGVDGDYQGVVDDIDQAGDDTSAVAAAIEKHYGEHLYARVPTLGAVWARPNWAIGFIPVDMSLDIGLHQFLGPSLAVTAYLDTTLAWAYAKTKKIKGKHPIAWGVTLKALHRAYYSDVLNAGTLASDEEIFDVEKSAEGMTIDADIGIMYAPPVKGWMQKHFRPTVAAVIRNVGDYGFPIQFEVFNDKNPKEPPKLQRRLDVGAKFDLTKLWVFSPKLAVDIKDMGHSNWTFEKGLHAGFEAYWKMFNWWQGHWSVGINQTYWTAGFGAKLGWFQIDLASWGEEVGTSGAPRESRRYIAELSLDF